MKEALIGAVIGAFLGALFGYWFAQYQQTRELKARRQTLLHLLIDELKQVRPTLDPYNAAKAYYRDPIRISAPGRLLDGGTLEYKDDARLIELLLNFNVATSRYNDFVSMTNTAQAMIAVPDNVHAKWYEVLKQHVGAITAVRDELAKEAESKGH